MYVQSSTLPKGGKILHGKCPCFRDKIHVWFYTAHCQTNFIHFFYLLGLGRGTTLYDLTLLNVSIDLEEGEGLDKSGRVDSLPRPSSYGNVRSEALPVLQSQGLCANAIQIFLTLHIYTLFFLLLQHGAAWIRNIKKCSKHMVVQFRGVQCTLNP